MTSEHVTFAVRIVPTTKRGRWSGEVVNLQTGRRAAISTSGQLGRFLNEETDVLTPPDTSEWTQIISAARHVADEAYELQLREA